MSSNLINVLHLGTEKTWRGGENQVRLFIENAPSNIKNFIAYPKNSDGFKRFAKLTTTLALPSAHPLDPRNYFALKKFIEKNKIQIIDTQSGNAHSMALTLRKLGVPVRLVVHRRVDNEIKDRLSTRHKYLHPYVDHFVAISECIRKMLIDYGVPEQKISLVHSAVNEDDYKSLHREQLQKQWRRQYQIPDSAVIIGNASAMTAQKGYDVLLRALKILHDREVPFFAFFAGDGHLRKMHEQLTRDLGLTESVKFLGHISNVRELLGALDILAMPSNNEGLGSLLLDAIFAGCAVAATDVGGIPEVIIHGETGLLSPVSDSEHLAAHLLRLADDEIYRQQLNEKARQHLRQNFSLQQMTLGNAQVYQCIL